ncbi:MAG: LL-diaminopimelate aminotransferase, partial [Thermoleophilia bacterium]|nr:LL-diaminopimelate aminotransferase [Thermoleophilia bacterium]
MSPRHADRLDRLAPYLFAELEQMIQDKRDAGIDVISLGIGEPDLPTPEGVVEELRRAVGRPDTHQYPSNKGRLGFREAIASFYEHRFGVKLDPATEILPVLGGKEGIFHICQVLLNVGDVALGTDPGYPVYTSGPLLTDAEPYLLPITPENDFKPDLASIPADILARSKLLFLNYPNNPTGAVIEPGDTFFEEVVQFAKDNDIVVVHDNAYSEISFDGYQAPSFLATPGAKDIGVEMFSLSKAWNMTGWRVGACVGNPEVVAAFWKYKTNVDSGMFDAVQAAATKALTEARDFPVEMSAIYQRRRDLVIGALRAIGLEPNAPKGSIYVWVRVPDGHTSASFAEQVLNEASVVVSPGSSFGAAGEGFVRISLSTPDDRLREAIERIEAS